MGCKAVGSMNIDINLKNCNATWSKIVEQKERDWLTISQETDEVIATLKAGNEALQLALETERGAANLYARQVAHWIGKHDALLEQQLVQRIETLPDVEMALRVANEYGTKDSQIDSGNLYAALRQCLDYIAQSVQPARCVYCDDTGDVHDATGEWRGTCTCAAGKFAQP